MAQFVCKTLALFFAICLIASASARPQGPTDAVVPEVPRGSEKTLARAATPGSLVQAGVKQMPEPDANGHLEIPDGTETIPTFAYSGRDGRDGKQNITSVTIPPTVTEIEKSAFEGCYELADVTFSGTSSLETIGPYAFSSNTELVSIAIPPTVTKIDAGAFNNCPKLATVTFSGTSSLKSIGRNAFYGAGLTVIDIPPTVIEIDEEAFEDCTNLATVTFTDVSSLETIGPNAFYYTGLTSVIIPSSATYDPSTTTIPSSSTSFPPSCTISTFDQATCSLSSDELTAQCMADAACKQAMAETLLR